MAASSGAIRAGRAFVELLTDDSKLVRGLRSAAAKLKGWGASISGLGTRMMGVGAAITGPMVLAAINAANSGAELYDMSKRTGLAVETLSLLGYAASQTGTDLETVEKAVRRMQASITGVADKAEGTTGNLTHLGIAAKDIVGLPVAEQMAMIGAALRAIPDPTERAAAAMKVFGRSGTTLLPMILSFNKLRDEASRMGFIKSTASAAEAKSFADAMTRMKKAVSTAWTAIGTAIMPILGRAIGGITNVVITIRDWIKAHAGLVTSVFLAGAALLAFGVAVKGVGFALGGLATVVTVVTIVIKVLAAVVAFLCSPIGLVVAAVVGLGVVFLHVTGMLGKLANWLGDCWNTLKDDALTAFGAIGDFLASGNIAGAAEVLWTLLKLEWARGTGWISVTWTKAMNFLVKVFTEAWGGLRIIAATVVNALASGWDWMVTGMAQAFAWLMAKVKQGWEWLKNGAANTWTWIRNKVGNISDEEAQASYRANNEARERAINSIDDEAAAEMASREQARQARQADRDKEYNDTVGGIVKEQMAREQALDAEVEAKEKAAQEEVAAARKRLDELAKQAKEQRADSERKNRSPEDIAAELKKVAGGAPGGLADAIDQNKTSARGIFNAEAILSLQAQSPLSRIAKAAEETARNTKKIAEQNTDPHFGGSPGAGY